MKRIFLFTCISLWIGIFLSLKPFLLISQAADQEFDLEEARLFPVGPDVSQLERKESSRQIKLANKEVKFISGKDGKWFTEDDEVYQYYLVEFDNKGKMYKKKSYIIGEDKIPFTQDDQLKEVWVYEYDAERKPAKETFYKVTSPDKNTEDYYVLSECNARGQKTKDIRYRNGEIIRYITYKYGPLGKMIQDVEYNGKGPDGRWLSADDEVEKYHGREYSKEGRLLRAMEYHADHQGRGPDNKWFTPDDVISSTRVFLYDDSGLVTGVNKYIDKGADNIWFSEDDLLQYYTRRQYCNK